ncbi:MAG: manganese efflux pump [Phycisphaerae bacterium]|jgi:putative Mn2+ efflux pump MntP|nr:manganese efflux pump [Phycisphaerae bacterium]
MPAWQTIILVLGLTMDTFAVAGAIALFHNRITFRLIFRVAFHFALFQAGLLYLGWGLGNFTGVFIQSFDHWIAATLLWLIGGKMLWESFHEPEERVLTDPSRGWSLVFLSVATSLDALAVGGSLGFLNTRITQTVIMAWAMTVVIAIMGLFCGKNAGKIIEKWAERLGGIVLIVIGFKVLISHLMA